MLGHGKSDYYIQGKEGNTSQPNPLSKSPLLCVNIFAEGAFIIVVRFSILQYSMETLM